MEKLKKGFYMADTSNGIYFYDDIMDLPEQDVVKVEMFKDCLDGLEDGEIIATHVDEYNEKEMIEIIEAYGL